MISAISRKILFPLHEKWKGHSTLEHLGELEKSQYFDKAKLLQLQSDKLKELMLSAYEHVPYYQKLFDDARVRPDDIIQAADLSKLPFLTKNAIRDNTEALKSRLSNDLQKFNTGGSTGEPLIFYIGKRRVSYDVAAKLRATRWWGVDIGDPEIVIWGSPVELTKQDRLRQVRDWIFRTKLLSAFDMTETRIVEYIERIRDMRPQHVFGYPSSISLIAGYARKKNIRMNDLGVKVVFCTAEKLYDHQKELLSDVCGAPVANGYGGRDSGFIAHECPEGRRMHITAESIIVEICDQMGNVLTEGQRGEIVITHLDTYEFPFIRYRTGDIGILSNDICSCGRGLPVLESIEGRTTDFIVTPEGKIMHGLALIYVLRDIQGIEEFKIIQEREDYLNVLVVKNEHFEEDSEDLIIHGLKKRTGPGMEIRVNYVAEIPSEKSGKFRYIVSQVSPSFMNDTPALL